MEKQPLTSAQKQSRRTADLDAIAQAAGWATWTRYATAVKRGVVSIERNSAAICANGRRGGRPRKETAMSEREMFERLGSQATPKNVKKWWGRMTQEQIKADMDVSWPSDDNEALAEAVYKYCRK